MFVIVLLLDCFTTTETLSKDSFEKSTGLVFEGSVSPVLEKSTTALPLVAVPKSRGLLNSKANTGDGLKKNVGVGLRKGTKKHFKANTIAEIKTNVTPAAVVRKNASRSTKEIIETTLIPDTSTPIQKDVTAVFKEDKKGIKVTNKETQVFYPLIKHNTLNLKMRTDNFNGTSQDLQKKDILTLEMLGKDDSVISRLDFSFFLDENAISTRCSKLLAYLKIFTITF